MNNEESLTYYEVILKQQELIVNQEKRIKRLETLYIKIAILLVVIVFGYGFCIINMKDKISEVKNDISVYNN